MCAWWWRRWWWWWGARRAPGREHLRRDAGAAEGSDAADHPGGRGGGGGVGGALRAAARDAVRAGAGAPLRAGPAHRRHAARHVPPPHRVPPPGAHLLQTRHHLQHGRVRRPAARPPGVLPLLHVERVLQARGHHARARARAGRQRARPARGVPALRGPHRGGGRRAPVHRRHRPRRAHRVQRAGLLAGVAHARQDARLRHAGGQQALLRQRHQQGAAAGAHRRRGHRARRQRGDDPHNGRAQGARAREGGGGGRQPHVDRLRVPAARADAVRVRRGGHARAARQDRQVLQGAERRAPAHDRRRAGPAAGAAALRRAHRRPPLRHTTSLMSEHNKLIAR